MTTVSATQSATQLPRARIVRPSIVIGKERGRDGEGGREGEGGEDGREKEGRTGEKNKGNSYANSKPCQTALKFKQIDLSAKLCSSQCKLANTFIQNKPGAHA